MPRLLSAGLGARATNKLLRKLEEVRLSLWLEEEMRRRYGSKEQAKREIFARSASFHYLGNDRYGFAAASEYYLDKRLSRCAFRGILLFNKHKADVSATFKTALCERCTGKPQHSGRRRRR